MSQPKLTGPSLLDPSSLRGRTCREVLCGSSRVEGITGIGVNGSKKGAPDVNLGTISRRWNVVKSVAETSSGYNLAVRRRRGYLSRGDVLPLERESKGGGTLKVR